MATPSAMSLFKASICLVQACPLRWASSRDPGLAAMDILTLAQAVSSRSTALSGKKRPLM